MPATLADRLNGILTSTAIKPPVRAATTANITLSGLQTVGGVVLADADRVLVRSQTDAKENGIWLASTSDWQRAKDFDGNRDIVQGTLIIRVNAINRAVYYQVATANPIVIGTTELSIVALNDPNIAFPITEAEITAGFTEDDLALGYPEPDVRRYGVVPNSLAAATANTTALNTLLDPATTLITGRMIFPNTTGADIYHFDDIMLLRRGVDFDLCGCTLSFAKSYAAADDLMGFLSMIGPNRIENGTIDVDYDGTAGTNAGSAIRIGSRESYPFGSDFPNGINDEDLTEPMGQVVLSNLNVVSNNPSTKMILMLGGLEDCVLENLRLNGQSAANAGIYYEFGHYHYDATPALRTTSHAHNLVFRNVTVKDLDPLTANADGLSLIGAYQATVENLHVDGANNAFVFRPGEALFYNVGAPYATGVKRGISLKNITAQNVTTSMVLTGAELASGGYLSGEGLTESEQVDLMSFSLDGFALAGTVTVSGPCDLRNGTIIDGGASGGLIISAECVQFDIDNMRILDGAGVGIRANFSNPIWAVQRLKIGSIRNSQVAGNVGVGIALNHTQSVLVENCRLGYSTLYDAAGETTQTNGVSAGTSVAGVVCRGNYVSTSGGAVAYALAATGDGNCSIETPRGLATNSGVWKIDGIARRAAASIADIGHIINTADKYLGKAVWDSSNNRILYALGSAAGDGWGLADGSVTVTPA